MVRRTSARDQRGQILILTALSMTVLLGMAALSIDASFMYDKRNQLYAAADNGAKAGAAELRRGNTNGNMSAFVQGYLTKSQGVDLSKTTVVVNAPPLSGPFTSVDGYVEVLVSEATSTFFGRLIGFNSLTPGARAVAGASNPNACLITQQDLSVGTATLDMTGCSVEVGGNLIGQQHPSTISPSSTPVSVTGTWNGTGSMGTVTQNAPSPVDPFAGPPALALPTNPGNCIAGTAATLPPGCYTSIEDTVRTLSGNGIYYVTGTVDVGLGNLVGSAPLLLFLTGMGHIQELQPGGTKILQLTGMQTGTAGNPNNLYTGIAIFQDPADTQPFDTSNNFEIDVTGAIYMPGSDVHFSNAITFGGSTCSLFIAHSLTIDNGNGLLNNSGCASTFAGASFLSVSIAE